MYTYYLRSAALKRSAFPARFAAALLIGLAAGALSGWTAAVTLQQGDLLDFWSALYGALGAVGFFGVALAVMGGGSAVKRIGGLLVAGVFACLALGVVFFFVRVGVPPPWTLEGAWQWPLGIASLVAVLLTLRWAMTRGRRSQGG